MASVEVRVCDPAGAVIPKAEVKFRGETDVTTLTSADGSAEVALPYGSYVVVITSPGFEKSEITGLRFEKNKPPPLNVVLQLDPNLGECFTCDNIHAETIASELPNVIETFHLPDATLPTITAVGPSELGLRRPPKVHVHIQVGQTQYVCSSDSEDRVMANGLKVGESVEIRQKGDNIEVRAVGRKKWVKLHLVSKDVLHNL